jgi:hypothetical protein
MIDSSQLDALLSKPPPAPPPLNYGTMGKAPSDETEKAKKKLENKIHHRIPSLTPAEAFFLHALLVDEGLPIGDESKGEPAPFTAPTSPLLTDQSEEEKVQFLEIAAKVLDDEVLFSVPEDLVQNKPRRSPVKSPRPRRPSRNHIGLWQAHEDGVAPKSLVMRSSLHSAGGGRVESSTIRYSDREEEEQQEQQNSEKPPEVDDTDDIPSDEEIRKDSKSDVSSNSSWGDDAIRDNYSSWEILKDEYAKDFGFDYNRSETVAEILNGEASDQHHFKIIGTSADDTSAHPHVLSPPLMDALMSFLPDALTNQNYWLKFSLARDGASLETLKQYSRASPNTILAIETGKGEVFGSFTSNPWRNGHGFYGGPPAYVWKMRKCRQTKCYSLYHQAKLESEIDVFMCAPTTSQMLQVCRHDALAIGGDNTAPSLDDFDDLHAAVKATERMGFAIALEDDLMIGTTSPSPSFSSPSLCGSGKTTETFEVANLEVWTFTPCMDVPSAERLEMSKFFLEESVHRFSEGSTSEFPSRDLNQEQFYRRVGYDPESEERRQRWQYLNMMHGTEQRGLGSGGIGASPRFGYSG